MSERRTIFPGWRLPLLLLAPQLLLTALFFLWPAAGAIEASLMRGDPFGLSARFVGLDNFTELFTDPLYLAAVGRTLLFCGAVSLLSLGLALVLAVLADSAIRGRAFYRTALIWPYAVAPVIAAVVWILLLHPQIGALPPLLSRLGIVWDYRLDGTQAMITVILASAWKQVSYNFIFFLAGLQSIPAAIVEAARMDGAGPLRRFWTILFPLLAPTTGFLVTVNIAYSAFETFGTIEALTQGGPAQATQTLVVKVYRDGVVNLDLGASSAQSVVLMAGVMLLTLLQFRLLRRRGDAI
ncbi:ABC transporter permease subunit [Aquabacter spiritensis]|uniref:sn-glycerol-3-phosphate transport system permease protein UgpA n=1 Tax=Aquabacter spiritensis TaxID=933073 RepID=A0A4R3LUW9_9HYPH|nr:ABC transporter permease subunit [Aquabacter spiritensis]TCT04343.1 carbohydrate ABC transporter membrane protein 1 (CUT1 family) [Aquabacter spiritensis]